jgi:hypothetical protein
MYKVILSLFLVLGSICHAEHRYQLSICAIFQDEASYLKEWIEFHRLMGVEHFYLYNHHSQDHYQEVLQPYILAGLVELKDQPAIADTLKAFNALQCKCYTECLTRARGISKWVAFLDIDEFLFPTKKQSIPDVLKNYEEFGGVGVNWLMFGPSHIWKIPPNQLLIESLTLCATPKFTGNRYVKSIVRPECASHFENPHQPVYQKGYFGVNTDKLPIEGMWSAYYQVNKLRINHYWTREGEYFYRQKMERHKRWRGDPEEKAIKNFIDNLNAEQDQAILKFVPALKKAMGH